MATLQYFGRKAPASGFAVFMTTFLPLFSRQKISASRGEKSDETTTRKVRLQKQ